jgi:hypothetical protein
MIDVKKTIAAEIAGHRHMEVPGANFAAKTLVQATLKLHRYHDIDYSQMTA